MTWRRWWPVALGVAVGMFSGLGFYTFVYAKGYSYLTNDPRACANCHIMSDQYAGWMKGSHRSVATCNDCHTPHTFVGKYTTKGLNGFWHSFYFTTGTFHEPIQINRRNRRITEDACRRCHADIVQSIDRHAKGADRLSCLGCHRDVGHLH